MTRTKAVMTKRMAQKTDFNITGTAGKVEAKVFPEPIGEVMIIKPELQLVSKPKAKKRARKSKKNG